jgi:hypothetical protein
MQRTLLPLGPRSLAAIPHVSISGPRGERSEERGARREALEAAAGRFDHTFLSSGLKVGYLDSKPEPSSPAVGLLSAWPRYSWLHLLSADCLLPFRVAPR